MKNILIHSPNHLGKKTFSVKGYVESNDDPDVLSFNECEYSIPVRTERFIKNSYTSAFSFKKSRLSRDRPSIYGFKLKVDTEDTIAESNEDNNESEVVRVNVDPANQITWRKPFLSD